MQGPTSCHGIKCCIGGSGLWCGLLGLRQEGDLIQAHSLSRKATSLRPGTGTPVPGPGGAEENVGSFSRGSPGERRRQPSSVVETPGTAECPGRSRPQLPSQDAASRRLGGSPEVHLISSPDFKFSS